MRGSNIALLIVMLATTVGCSNKQGSGEGGVVAKPVAEETSSERDDAGDPAPDQDAQVESIGSATMKEDGTLVLQLRAEGEGGMVGDAYFEYKPDDLRYQETLDHLGGLQPGETKPVPPWPSE